jgi:hypothetical protein
MGHEYQQVHLPVRPISFQRIIHGGEDDGKIPRRSRSSLVLTICLATFVVETMQKIVVTAKKKKFNINTGS